MTKGARMIRITPEELALDHIYDSIGQLKEERERLIKEVFKRRRLDKIERFRDVFPINIYFDIFHPFGADYECYCNYLGAICNLIRAYEKENDKYWEEECE